MEIHLTPEPREPVKVGDLVRAQVKGKRPVIGRVIAEARGGSCWELLTLKGREFWAKGKCEKIKANEATKETRALGRPYGDGEV